MVDAHQRERMEKHLSLVIEMNKRINLTRVDSLEAGRVLHIEDSLAGLQEVNESIDGLYADLGTGAGFPGIEIAIATGRPTLLVDSVEKKVKALESILDSLELSDQVNTYAGRIEDLSLEQPEEFSVVTARALTALPSLIELASPLLKPNGRIVCYKSAQYHDELDHALSIQDKLGMKHVSTRMLELSDGTPRSIIVFEKAAEPLVKLPRRPGMAQKRPYK